MPKDYWPETEPIADASFVSEDGGVTWTPLCCGEPMTYHFTPWSNWDCGECGVRHLIWAEDFPSVTPHESSAACTAFEYLDDDTDGTPWSRCGVHGHEVIGNADEDDLDAYMWCEGYRAPAYVDPTA